MSKLIALLFSLLVNSSFAVTEIEMARDVINLYQQHSVIRFGHYIQFAVEESSRVNAFARISPNNPPLISITTGALHALSDQAVVATICHELGHFFGNPIFKKYPEMKHSPIIEAEADYFTGTCLVNYLRSIKGFSHKKGIDGAIKIAEQEAPVYYKKRVNCNQAYAHTYTSTGWNMDYPAPECRVLSIVHAAREWQRPSCWYNPKK